MHFNFKFTLKPPNSIMHDKLWLTIWNTFLLHSFGQIWTQWTLRHILGPILVIFDISYHTTALLGCGPLSANCPDVKKVGFFLFFLKFLLDTCPFVGPLIPLFWTSGDVSSGFQSQSGFCLIQTCGGVRNIHSLRFTSGATHLPVYNASIAASRLPHMRVSAEVGCRDLNRRPPARQSDALPTRPRRPA